MSSSAIAHERNDGPSSEHPEKDLDCLRNKLLPATVRNAWEGSPFYRALYAKAGVDPDAVRDLADLPKLPIVRKEEVRRAGADARCRAATERVALLQHTTGTTGEPFFFYRSTKELRFISEFFSDLRQEQPSGPRPLMLVLTGLDWHGTPTPVPGNTFPIHCGLYSEDYADLAVKLMRRRFDIPGVNERVNVLCGSNELLMFTHWCAQKGIDPGKEFGIQLIQMTGFYLTERWRRKLEEAWQAPVIDRYTMSEHFGGATYSLQDRGYRFDPHIVYELIDFSGRPCAPGQPGMLLLTSLYPFVQLQPLIRYWTGDIFTHVSPGPGRAPIFRFLGREKHALFHPQRPTELLVTGVDAVEALDPHPEVARTVNFPGRRLRYESADGFPIFRGSYAQKAGRLEVTLKVECQLPLHLFGDRQRTLAEAIRAGLLARCPRLAALVDAGEAAVAVELVAPGDLQVALGNENDMMDDRPGVWARAAS
jgi:hypothetical protein